MGQTEACGLCMAVGAEVVGESDRCLHGGQRRAGLFSTHGGELMMV